MTNAARVSLAPRLGVASSSLPAWPRGPCSHMQPFSPSSPAAWLLLLSRASARAHDVLRVLPLSTTAPSSTAWQTSCSLSSRTFCPTRLPALPRLLFGTPLPCFVHLGTIALLAPVWRGRLSALILYFFLRALFPQHHSSYEVKHDERRAQAQPGRRPGAGPLSHLALASRSLTGGSAPSTHVSPNSGEEGSPPPHVRLHSGSAQQFGDTREGHPVREPPTTDLEAGGSAGSGGAQGKCGCACGVESGAGLGRVHGQPPAAERRQLGRGSQGWCPQRPAHRPDWRGAAVTTLRVDSRDD